MFKISVHAVWVNQTSHLLNEKTEINQDIKNIKEKIAYMVELVSSKRLDPDDYMESKTANNRKLELLNGRLNELNLEKTDIEELLDTGINNLLKLEYAYSIGDIDKKREIVGVVFPDKMDVVNGVLRTGRVNEVIKYIYQADSELEGKKRTNQKPF